MALSNANGWIVLTTGNKSEMATGYSTLYGDSAGGFAVIKDVAKTLVYELCRYRNARAGTELIPEAVLAKPPSAELRPDQRDDESLPPYEVLDPVMAGYVEGDRSADDLVAEGFDPAAVARVVGPGRPGRVQAPPDATRGPDLRQGVRQGSPHADHQPLPLRGPVPPPPSTGRRPLSDLSTDPSADAAPAPETWRRPAARHHRRPGRGVPLDRDRPSTPRSGPGSSDLPLAGVQVHLDAQSMRHAWHAELFADRLPVRAGVDPDALDPPLLRHGRRACRPGRGRADR